MKLFAILPLVTLAAAAKSFVAMNIMEGSKYHHNHLLNDAGVVRVKETTGISMVLNDDGSLVDSVTKEYIKYIDGHFKTSQEADKMYSIDQGYLKYKGKHFTVCPEADWLSISEYKCKDCQELHLSCQNLCDADNVYPNPPKHDQFVIKAWSTQSDQFKDTKVFKVDSHPHVFSVDGNEGKEVFLRFQLDGTSLVDQDGRGINLDPNTGEFGNVAPFGRAEASKGFSLKGDHLIFNGKDAWRACPSAENKFSLALSECFGGTDIVLQVVWIN